MISKKTVREIWDASMMVTYPHYQFVWDDDPNQAPSPPNDDEKRVTPQEEVILLLAMRERIDIHLQDLRSQYLKEGRYPDFERTK